MNLYMYMYMVYLFQNDMYIYIYGEGLSSFLRVLSVGILLQGSLLCPGHTLLEALEQPTKRLHLRRLQNGVRKVHE